MDEAQRLLTANAGARLTLIAESFARLTGRPLLGGALVSADALWTAPKVILAHGTQPDPIFFYGGNRDERIAAEEALQILRAGLGSRVSVQVTKCLAERRQKGSHQRGVAGSESANRDRKWHIRVHVDAAQAAFA